MTWFDHSWDVDYSRCLLAWNPTTPQPPDFPLVFFLANHDSHPGKQKKDIINQPKMHRWWLQKSIKNNPPFFMDVGEEYKTSPFQKIRVCYEEISFTKQILTNPFFLDAPWFLDVFDLTSKVGTPCRCRPTTLLLENQVPLDPILGGCDVAWGGWVFVGDPMGFIHESLVENTQAIGISGFLAEESPWEMEHGFDLFDFVGVVFCYWKLFWEYFWMRCGNENLLFMMVRTCWVSEPDLILFQLYNLCTQMYRVYFGVLPLLSRWQMKVYRDPLPKM